MFSLAAAMHPLVTQPVLVFERGEAEAKARIAAEIGRPWAAIEPALYLDVIDRQPLLTFDGALAPEALLSRYNLAQLQACLYKAQRMTVLASADFAVIVRHAKLARLLVETRRAAGGRFQIDLSGPASVLHETRRYGVHFARFVASLIACRGWEMLANVMTPWGTTVTVRISSDDGYRSHLAPPP